MKSVLLLASIALSGADTKTSTATPTNVVNVIFVPPTTVVSDSCHEVKINIGFVADADLSEQSIGSGPFEIYFPDNLIDVSMPVTIARTSGSLVAPSTPCITNRAGSGKTRCSTNDPLPYDAPMTMQLAFTPITGSSQLEIHAGVESGILNWVGVALTFPQFSPCDSTTLTPVDVTFPTETHVQSVPPSPPSPPVPTPVPGPGTANAITSDHAASVCPALAFAGYSTSCDGFVAGAAVPHGTVCSSLGCGADYDGVAAGTAVCTKGEWEVSLSGCTPSAVSPVGCSDMILPDGHVANDGCDATATGGTCNTMCADGFDGVAHGSAVCYSGVWHSNIGGCHPRCVVPESFCTPGSGMKDGYTVQRVVGAQHPSQTIVSDENCTFNAGNASFLAAKLGCAPGYVWDTVVVGDKQPSLCFGGAFLGGAFANPPKCVPADSVASQKCGCGSDALLVALAATVPYGLVRDTSNDGWQCGVIGKVYSCTCAPTC